MVSDSNAAAAIGAKDEIEVGNSDSRLMTQLRESQVVNKHEFYMLGLFLDRHAPDFVEKQVLRIIFEHAISCDISSALKNWLSQFRRDLGL